MLWVGRDSLKLGIYLAAALAEHWGVLPLALLIRFRQYARQSMRIGAKGFGNAHEPDAIGIGHGAHA